MSHKTTRKEKIRAQVRKQQQHEADLLAFLRNYGDSEPPQDAADALFDNQIKSIFTSLAEVIDKSDTGTMIDVGCGNGTILSRLTELPSFITKQGWSYLGVDFEEYKGPLISIAVDGGVHRKVDFMPLDDFYKQWPNVTELSKPHFVFSRNVLHELDINKTALFLSHTTNNLAAGEKLLVQDLLVFPKAEKGHVCWEAESLKQLLDESGFNSYLTVEQSRNGGRWVNIIATRNELAAPDLLTLKLSIIKYRLQQWDKWKKLGALHQYDEKFRDVRVAKIDFDLQYAVLNAQLIAVHAKGVSQLQPAQEALILKESFARALNSFKLAKPKNILEVVDSVPYFVNRGNSKNGLEKFIVSKEKITLIQGQPLMGKTELVKEVLSKFHHNRFPVLVDVQATSSVWNIVEGILGSIRCNVPSSVFSSLRSTSFSDIKDELLDALEEYSSEIIFVFDHVERLLNPGGLICDRDIKDLLQSLAMPNSKIILTSSRTVDLSFFHSEDVFPEQQPLVGRFPEGPPHVNQLLGLLAGIKDCPDEIIKSIDRHPLLAVLAGLCVRKNGVDVLSDEKLIKELKNDMRAALLHRISDDVSRPAIDVISHIRIPVPRDMLVKLSSLGSVKSAEDLGLIYCERDSTRNDLLSCIGAMRFWSDNGEGVEADSETEAVRDAAENVLHLEIARQYHEVYRKDDDPKWIREIYYHKLLSGDESAINEFGGYYRSEIFGAGEYWFRRKKKFDLAYWAFSIAAKYGENGAFLRMRSASCLIRIGRRRDGEKAFDALMDEFPKAKHIVSSYVDSLIYIDAFGEALRILENNKINYTDGAWHAVQFGRIYMGLHQYPNAIEAFKTHLQFETTPIAFHNLARAYHKIGDTPNELKILQRGLGLHSDSKRLQLAMAALLERTGKAEDAKAVLMNMFEAEPCNGWVVFPLIKVLCKCNESKTALKIFGEVQDKIYPEFLRATILSEVEIIKKQFRRAIDILNSRDQDEHSVGQTLEAYYIWAMDVKDPEERVSIAREGLSIKVDASIINNVPILFSIGKLAVVANDKVEYNNIKGLIASINPDTTVLQEFAHSMHSDWVL